MKELTVITKVVLKQIVTDQYKEKLILQAQEKIRKLEMEIDLLEEKMNNVINELVQQNHPQVDIVEEKLKSELDNKNNLKEEYLDKLKEISCLKKDTEVIQGTIDSPVTLGVGENIEKLLSREIVVRDEIIIEIR